MLFRSEFLDWGQARRRWQAGTAIFERVNLSHGTALRLRGYGYVAEGDLGGGFQRRVNGGVEVPMSEVQEVWDRVVLGG